LYADHNRWLIVAYRAEEEALIQAWPSLYLSIERERGEHERTRLLTALQTSNDQLAQSNVQLAQVNRTAKSDFISISHEFRHNP